MRIWRPILVTAIATLWVAAGSHCRLEALSGFEFLSCCQHSEADRGPAHHEKECNGDGCAAIELGFYRLEQTQPAPVRPSLDLVAWLIPLPNHSEPRTSELPIIPASSTPDLPRFWQFAQRTALPPRAPSLTS